VTTAADAVRAAEAAARASYGRLVAYLAARSRHLAAAEDALAEAFRAALETWPTQGVPERPEAWLLVAARSKLVDGARRAAVRSEAVATLRLMAEEAEEASTPGPFPDERLGLLFICAHPAIDPGVRTPLMLQAVLGLKAARIASAFCVAPAAMSQRLVRAKAKIRLAGIPCEVPAPHELPGRLDAVLDAIYAAYGAGWDDAGGVDPRRSGLAAEAIWLARLVVEAMPGQAEALGLLALMLHCEARRPARRSPDGAYVPLSEQDVSRWSDALIAEAEAHLRAAAALGCPGRFQLEAAIQSVHAHRVVSGRTDWQEIALLYDALVGMSPTLGAVVGRAAALGGARDAEAALAALDAIDPAAVTAYQPYWAVRAHLLSELGRDEADEAYARAIGLSEDPGVRAFLLLRRAARTA